jgi:hypothetical protein
MVAEHCMFLKNRQSHLFYGGPVRISHSLFKGNSGTLTATLESCSFEVDLVKKWYENIDINKPLPQIPQYVKHNYPFKAGDIVFDPNGFLGLTGHILLIEGNFTDPNGHPYCRTIEADGYESDLEITTGVWRSCLDDEYMDTGLIIFRVPNANDAQRQAAINFAIKQLGKSYSFEYVHAISGVPFAADTSAW